MPNPQTLLHQSRFKIVILPTAVLHTFLKTRGKGFVMVTNDFCLPLESEPSHLLMASISSEVSKPRPESKKAPSLVMTAAVTKSQTIRKAQLCPVALFPLPPCSHMLPHLQPGIARIPHHFPSPKMLTHTLPSPGPLHSPMPAQKKFAEHDKSPGS